MKKKPPKKELALDMPFAEVMERYIGTDPQQLHATIAMSKKKKPPGGKKKKRRPPGKKGKPTNVISMRERLMSLNARGKI